MAPVLGWQLLIHLFLALSFAQRGPGRGPGQGPHPGDHGGRGVSDCIYHDPCTPCGGAPVLGPAKRKQVSATVTGSMPRTASPLLPPGPCANTTATSQDATSPDPQSQSERPRILLPECSPIQFYTETQVPSPPPNELSTDSPAETWSTWTSIDDGVGSARINYTHTTSIPSFLADCAFLSGFSASFCGSSTMPGTPRDTEPLTEAIPPATTKPAKTSENPDAEAITIIIMSHHSMYDTTSTVTRTLSAPTISAALPASSHTHDHANGSTAASSSSSSSSSSSAPIAAIIVPVALTAFIALLILPCLIRRCMPGLWRRINAVLPVEDLYRGLAAVWERLRLTRRRNREVRARTALTGDKRLGGSGSGRWSEKGGGEMGSEEADGGVVGVAKEVVELGLLERWRRKQEEKLGQLQVRRALEERWGVGTGLGERSLSGKLNGAGGDGGAKCLEDVRREELRRVREGREAGLGF